MVRWEDYILILKSFLGQFINESWHDITTGVRPTAKHIPHFGSRKLACLEKQKIVFGWTKRDILVSAHFLLQ